MAILSATTAVNGAVAGARSLPGLITNLQSIDPTLATQLTAKPLLASKSPWGTLAAGAVGWLSARYGLGLDDTTTALIAGLCVLAGSYAMRAITKQPTSGLVTVVPPAISADEAPIAKTLGVIVLLAAGLSLSACTTAQQAATSKAVADGQLFCAKATGAGPLVVALANADGAPVTVTGAASADVAAACQVIGAIPVSPPANPAAAPVVAASVKAAP